MITCLSAATACGLTLVMMAVDDLLVSRGDIGTVGIIIVVTLFFFICVVPCIITRFPHANIFRNVGKDRQHKPDLPSPANSLANVIGSQGISGNDALREVARDNICLNETLKPRMHTCAVACRRSLCIAVEATLLFFLGLWLNRANSYRHIDDLHPQKDCPLIEELATQSLTYAWIIPFLNGTSIADYPEWCAHMKALEDSGRVTLGMHGVNHSTNEFEFECCSRDARAKLDAGIAEWELCFKAKPEHFAAPFGFMSETNRDLIRNEYSMHSRTIIKGGLFHRLYHCWDGWCPSAFMCTTSFLNVF